MYKQFRHRVHRHNTQITDQAFTGTARFMQRSNLIMCKYVSLYAMFFSATRLPHYVYVIVFDESTYFLFVNCVHRIYRHRRCCFHASHVSSYKLGVVQWLLLTTV